MIKIAINGFGRIGRGVFRSLLENNNLKVVAINDLTDSRTLSHLLKYDSVYGSYKKDVGFNENHILINGEKFQIFSEKNPEKLPWNKLGVDIVLECTGRFRHYDDAKKHLIAGAKKVIISASSKNPDKIPSIVMGVNHLNFEVKDIDIFDMASCTTNCLAPIVKILDDELGIEKGLMTTVHSYTADQRILDAPHKDLRRARSAAINAVPTTTGAAKAIGDVIPELKGKIDGMAIRVPIPIVSIVDLVCSVKRKTTTEEVNKIFEEKSKDKNWEGIFRVEKEPLVSSDYIGDSFSSILDIGSTKVIDNLVKIVSWYDNEAGYSNRLSDFAEYISKKI